MRLRFAPLLTAAGLGLLVLLPVPGSGQGVKPEVVVSTGRAGGYYDAVGTRLRSVLTVEHETYTQLRTSQGSLDNLARLDDPKSDVNVGLTQADALRRYLDEHPNFAKRMMVLGDVGRECVFIISSKKGPIAAAADLKAPGEREISVDDGQSGAAVTYAYMTALEPGFGNTRAVNVGTMEALLQIKEAGEFSRVEAAMLVQRPNTVSPPIEVVLAHLGDFRVVPILPADLPNNTEVSGKPVYSFHKVSSGSGKGHSVSFDTICTRGLLVASRPKLSKTARNTLSQVMLTSADLIAPGRD